MAAVVASGPIGINLNGRFYLIPLSVLDISQTGAITADRWFVKTEENKGRIKARLKALLDSGVLRRTEAPAVVPALIITAAQPGAAGNRIEVEFANVDGDATPPTADTAVTEIDTYELLTLASIEQMLGTAPGTGTSPGLVFVIDVNEDTLPEDNKTYPLAIAGAGSQAQAVVTAPAGAANPAAFTVKASKDGDDGEDITVEIKDVDTTAGTFTLVATWTKTMSDVTLDPVEQLNDEFGYLITVEPPTGATAPLPPAAGKTRLRGGAAAARPAVPAHATIWSDN